MELLIRGCDVGDAQLRSLVEVHRAFALEVTEPGFVHALDEQGASDPSVRFYVAACAGDVVGMGALRPLDERHVEVKSMHVLASARGGGVGRALLDHLLATAVSEGYTRVSLETGTAAAFAPARRLYLGAGFEVCEPFGTYEATPHNVCMTRELP